MNCRDLEQQVTAYLDGELIGEAQLEVEEHLAGCAPCAHRVDVERHNLSAIRQAARAAAPVAPEGLRLRLSEQLGRDVQRHSRARVVRVFAVAAGLTVAVVVGNQQYRGHQRRLFEQDAARGHARHFPLEIVQPPEAIEQWFGGKLDHRVSLPRFPNATATGGRLLQVRDKPAAYIRYDSPRPMGLFVYGDDHEVDVDARPALGTSQGYNVVSWREGDVVYQLVTDLDEQDIRDLMPPAHELAPATPDVRPAALQR